MLLRVIGSKVEEKTFFFGFSRFWPKKHGLTPLDFAQIFKFSLTLSIGKRSREMIFGVVSRAI